MEARYPRLAEIPFDSERKRMTTLNRMSDKLLHANVKGGHDEVVKVCNRILDQGKIRELTEDDRRKISEANETMARSALRVLAIAYKELQEVPQKMEISEIENKLIFSGLIGMIDPARPEAIEAVKKCNTAGIRAVMITGDHKITAMAIACQIGILKEGDLSISGAELEKLSDAQLAENIHRYSVYARVAPEHKVRIVKAWQNQNEVVAMTGDGVNDAPALKQADIGAAMGITGTDVAKGAADIILTDDNFATIVSAVEEGRRIYDNILKTIQFLVSCNVGEILLLLVTSVLNLGAPLLPIHILWINLVTDSLPALALSVEPAEPNIMQRKPHRSRKNILSGEVIWRIAYQGAMIGAIPLVAYLIGIRQEGSATGQTMAFTTLIFAQLVHVRNLQSNSKLAITINPLRNKYLLGSILISVILAFVVLAPGFRSIFDLVGLNFQQWMIVLGLSLIPAVLVDLFKLLRINGGIPAK
jgi:Ca2+-transporting ATPase